VGTYCFPFASLVNHLQPVVHSSFWAIELPKSIWGSSGKSIEPFSADLSSLPAPFRITSGIFSVAKHVKAWRCRTLGTNNKRHSLTEIIVCSDRIRYICDVTNPRWLISACLTPSVLRSLAAVEQGTWHQCSTAFCHKSFWFRSCAHHS
jgi:hypothetical protein